jgi:hypothetical protein
MVGVCGLATSLSIELQHGSIGVRPARSGGGRAGAWTLLPALPWPRLP